MFSSIIRPLVYPTLPIGNKRLEKHFSNKRVIITGASHGIGRELAYLLMGAKADLILVARTESELIKICEDANKAGCQATYRAIDLREREKLDAFCKELSEDNQQIDYFFANAGKSIHRPIFEAYDRLHDYDRTIDLNYKSLVAISLAILPQMSRKGGCIIYTSAVSTLFPLAPNWSAYHASKCAGNAWCDTADAEFAKRNVRVKTAYLPLVHTQMSDINPTYQKMPAFSAKEAANVLAKLASGLCSSYKPWWARIAAPISYLLSPLVKFIYRHI